MRRDLTLLAFTVISLSMAIAKEPLLSRTEPDTIIPFVVDTSKDFHFELGRGSGMDGLDTIAFGRDGLVTLFRQKPQGKWQTSRLQLQAEAIGRVFDSVRAEKVMQMAAAYHAVVQDGTQWVLWITQGKNSKAIYCNNYFTKEIQALAKLLDKELATAGLASAHWTEVPSERFGEHQKPLWNSIKSPRTD